MISIVNDLFNWGLFTSYSALFLTSSNLQSIELFHFTALFNTLNVLLKHKTLLCTVQFAFRQLHCCTLCNQTWTNINTNFCNDSSYWNKLNDAYLHVSILLSGQTLRPSDCMIQQCQTTTVQFNDHYLYGSISMVNFFLSMHLYLN